MTTAERKELKKTKSDYKKSVVNGSFAAGRQALIQQIATFPAGKLKANWKFGMLQLN
jgi:hypothetical protein